MIHFHTHVKMLLFSFFSNILHLTHTIQLAAYLMGHCVNPNLSNTNTSHLIYYYHYKLLS